MRAAPCGTLFSSHSPSPDNLTMPTAPTVTAPTCLLSSCLAYPVAFKVTSTWMSRKHLKLNLPQTEFSILSAPNSTHLGMVLQVRLSHLGERTTDCPAAPQNLRRASCSLPSPPPATTTRQHAQGPYLQRMSQAPLHTHCRHTPHHHRQPDAISHFRAVLPSTLHTQRGCT